jgi:undecaprenyl-diphosphatase
VLAVAWFYRHDLFARLAALPSSRPARRFWLNLLLAFLPAGLLGFLLGDRIKEALFRPAVVAVSLIVGGVVLWLVERRLRAKGSPEVELGPGGLRDLDGPGPRGLDAVTPRQALLVGLAQITALVPGVSRSGSSIVGGLLAGLDRETATAFSFYLALPTLGGATLYDLLRNLGEIAARGEGLRFAVGTVVAFFTALAAVGWLLRFVARNDFRGFAVYRVLAGLAILAFSL